MQKTSTAASLVKTQGLHQLVGGSTCPGYSIQRFYGNSVKFLADQNYLAFIWNKCCHLTLCLHLMEPYRLKSYNFNFAWISLLSSDILSLNTSR